MRNYNPPFDASNAYFKAVCDDHRLRFFPSEPELTNYLTRLRQYLRKGYCQPYVREFMRIVLSGDWKIGRTQAEVARWLGIDAASISDAIRFGAISTEALIRLLTCASRPQHWDPNSVPAMKFEMERSSLIHAAPIAYSGQSRERLDLSELDFELVCAYWRRIDDWECTRTKGAKAELAQAITRHVVDRDANYLLRWWYNKREMRELNTRLNSLSQDSGFAFEYLSDVIDTWEPPIAFTLWAKSSMGW